MESIRPHKMGDDYDAFIIMLICVLILNVWRTFQIIQKKLNFTEKMSNFRLSHILQSKSHKLFSKAFHPVRACKKRKVSVFVSTFSNLKQLTLGALGNSRMQPQLNVSCYLQAGHDNVLILQKPTKLSNLAKYSKITWIHLLLCVKFLQS